MKHRKEISIGTNKIMKIYQIKNWETLERDKKNSPKIPVATKWCFFICLILEVWRLSLSPSYISIKNDYIIYLIYKFSPRGLFFFFCVYLSLFFFILILLLFLVCFSLFIYFISSFVVYVCFLCCLIIYALFSGTFRFDST